ncbi:hypothetical protein Gotur_001109 [Gossypium turneri]
MGLTTLTAAPPSAEPARNAAPPIRMEGLRPKAPVTGDAKKDEIRPAILPMSPHLPFGCKI